jgi:hypothetical protein
MVSRLTVMWLLLVVATCVSFEAGSVAARYAGGVVLLVAFLKVRIVMFEFMEVAHAPRVLRLFCDGWILVLLIALTAMYAMQAPASAI